jgi:anti-anti-sigma factor
MLTMPINMKVKISTKPKFHAITIEEPLLAANMTADLSDCILPVLQNDVKNILLNLKDIETMDIAAAEAIIDLQAEFNRHRASFVVCDLQPQVSKSLVDAKLLDLMNNAPTESEASDLIHMEEIERELTD